MMKILLLLWFGIELMAKTQTIVFGAGCFWGVEKHFDNLEGVVKATSGFAGGNYKNPTYRKVIKQKKPSPNVINHAEVVEVVYDDARISTKTLIQSFWELHDPTQGNRQGNSKGNNYRSVLYYTNNEQKNVAQNTKKIYQNLLNKEGYGTITTEVKSLDKFYPAKEHHQNYLEKKPLRYCPNHRTGVKFTKEDLNTQFISPLGGKEIVVIDAAYCKFCERFKARVTDQYAGSIPLRTVHQEALRGFHLKTKILGTPTVVFINDGYEVYAHTGYMNEKVFYKAVGAFKLGKDSKGYEVAFKKSTDRAFCKKYEAFKNTGDGAFRDKISGDILFDTRDRFNAGSGWLSFFKAVDGATFQKKDSVFGDRRVEIIAKKSGAHLGHMFHDGPNGRNRFCINATILEFIPREKMGK